MARKKREREEIQMRNIVLVGMPGCGKSTIGVLAAKALTMDFVDTDLTLQKMGGKPLQQMVDELGTAGFSRAEEECICSLHFENTVIATGGSVALEKGAMEHLRRDGYVVFIHLSYETIEQRLSNIKTRGIAMEKGQTLRDLYNLRQPYYFGCADAILEADGLNIEETVAKLADIVRSSAFEP